MPLDPSYLEYPLRRRGMDHDLYEWSSIFDRPDVSWPGGRKLAVGVFVSLEWFPILPEDKPFRAPGHMQTAYPDYRHYTSREYGTRIGFYRFLDAFKRYGVTASIVMNSAIAQRYPAILEDIAAAGHEIIAHSTDMNGTIASGISEADESRLIAESLDTIHQATGTRPRGWMSIARSQSFNTPRLLKDAGVEYMCDWVNDDLPYQMRTRSGPILNIPVNHELSDRQIITVQQQSADSYCQQLQDASLWLRGEAGSRFLPVHVTPYIMGLPYRIDAFERLLKWLRDQPDVAFLPAAQIATPYL